jgi:hypothetical protein
MKSYYAFDPGQPPDPVQKIMIEVVRDCGEPRIETDVTRCLPRFECVFETPELDKILVFELAHAKRFASSLA